MSEGTKAATKFPLRALGWVPLILALSIKVTLTSTILWDGAYAVIPLAAWLGAEYGRKGSRAVLLGGLLLPLGLDLGPYNAGLHLDVYLIALLACRMAASQRPLRAWVPAFDSKKQWVAAFALLPLSVVFYHGELVDDLPVLLGFDLYGLFMLWLFAMGMAGRKGGPIVMGLAAAATAGMVLDYFGWPPKAGEILEARRAYLPVLGLTELRQMGVEYGLNSPLGWLTGAGYFWGGCFLARLMDKRAEVLPSPWRALVWVSLASVFALGNWDAYLFDRVLHWPRYTALNVMGSIVALILVSLMAGVLLGRRGIGLTTGLVVMFWWLNGLVLSGFDFARPYILFRLQEIVYAVGFGALGVRLRDRALGQETFLFSRRGVVYALLLGILAFSVLLQKGPFYEKMIVLGVCASVVGLAVLARYLRRRFDHWRAEAHGAWVSLLGVIVLAVVAWQRFGEIARAFKPVLEAVRNAASVFRRDLARMVDGEMIFFVMLVLLYLWLLLTALQALVINLPALIQDLKRIWAGLKNMPKGEGKVVVKLSPKKEAKENRAGGLIDRLVKGSGYVRRGVLTTAFILPLALLVITVYPRDGLWAGLKYFYQDHIQAPPVIRQIPPECGEKSADPFLWQAAMAYIGDKPLSEADPCRYTGRIKTDWFVSSRKPLQRTRLNLYLDEKLTETAVDVYIDKQERRLGLIWVEIDADRAERNQIEEEIYSRAERLADSETL